MKKIGIWMDKKKAKLVTLGETGDTIDTLVSEVEFFNLKSGSQARVKWGGPQDVVHERTYLEREKHQMKTYFTKLAHSIKEVDDIALFGPADTAEMFSKELKANHKSLAAKVKCVTKADSMTDNQIKALVKDFFQTTK